MKISFGLLYRRKIKSTQRGNFYVEINEILIENLVQIIFLCSLLSTISIEYWFKFMDLDGDGYLSTYELEFFYTEQYCRMEALSVEAAKFEDLLCQVTFTM